MLIFACMNADPHCNVYRVYTLRSIKTAAAQVESSSAKSEDSLAANEKEKN